jgi:hypothetical protein
MLLPMYGNSLYINPASNPATRAPEIGYANDCKLMLDAAYLIARDVKLTHPT